MQTEQARVLALLHMASECDLISAPKELLQAANEWIVQIQNANRGRDVIQNAYHVALGRRMTDEELDWLERSL